jgi:hypothetical protein
MTNFARDFRPASNPGFFSAPRQTLRSPAKSPGIAVRVMLAAGDSEF